VRVKSIKSHPVPPLFEILLGFVEMVETDFHECFSEISQRDVVAEPFFEFSQRFAFCGLCVRL
jgi:hypothetical protein